MKYLLKLIPFCLLLVYQAKAQQSASNTYHFSLQEAVDYAQKHQATVLNAQIDEHIAKNTGRQTAGMGLPHVNANFNFQDFLDIPTSIVPGENFGRPVGTEIPLKFGINYQSLAGLEVSQLLFDGSYIAALQASVAYKELFVRQLKRTRIETTVAVTKAYYGVLISHEQLNLLDANLGRLRKSVHDIEALLNNGLVEKIDVDRLLVLKNNLETERENVIRLLSLNVNLLKFQMGMLLEYTLTLKDSIASLETAPTVVIPDSTSYQNRIEYSLVQTQKKLNYFDLKRYKSQFLPSVVAFGSALRSFQSNNFSRLFDKSYPATVIGLRVSLPIMNGGQRLCNIRNAKLALLKSENIMEELKNGISLEISQAQIAYTNGLKSLENQKRNIALAKEVLRVSQVKYEQGLGSSLEVTSAETSLKESQNNYIRALYDMLINKVNLDKALGNIKY